MSEPRQRPPKTTKTARGGRRLTFDGVAVPRPITVLPQAPLHFTLALEDGEQAVVDLSGLPDIPLAREMAAALAQLGAPSGTLKTAGTVRTVVRASAFTVIPFWQQAFPGVSSVREMTPAQVDAYEAHLRQRYPAGSATWYQHLNTSVWVLRTASEIVGGASEDLKERLAYASRARKPESTPLDAFSPYVRKQIRDACRTQMNAALRRLTVTGPARLANGTDPRALPPESAPWREPANVLWYLDRVGPVPTASLLAAGARVTDLRKVKLESLPSRLYATSLDLYPFFVMLCLESALPPECVLGLRVTDLGEEDDGWATLHFIKRRAGPRAVQSRRVRTGGWATPGGLFKQVVRLTQALRRHYPSEALWICIPSKPRGDANGRGQALEMVPSTIASAARLMWAEHRVTLDDGSRLKSLDHRRLRKTGKAQRYIETDGQLEDFADDHTPQVAFQHYARVPRLAHLHEQTVAAGQQAALDAALGATVVLPEQEQEVRASPARALPVLGVPAEQAEPLLAGEQDVWLASCKDIRNSPYAKPGELCPASAWGCLPCRNAVITGRKLPNLIAFLNFLHGRRSTMEPADWRHTFGEAHARVRTVLARFPEEMVIAARAIAESDETLIYLPIELRTAGGQP